MWVANVHHTGRDGAPAEFLKNHIIPAGLDTKMDSIRKLVSTHAPDLPYADVKKYANFKKKVLTICVQPDQKAHILQTLYTKRNSFTKLNKRYYTNATLEPEMSSASSSPKMQKKTPSAAAAIEMAIVNDVTDPIVSEAPSVDNFVYPLPEINAAEYGVGVVTFPANKITIFAESPSEAVFVDYKRELQHLITNDIKQITGRFK